jgi:hypothetical protein
VPEGSGLADFRAEDEMAGIPLEMSSFVLALEEWPLITKM